MTKENFNVLSRESQFDILATDFGVEMILLQNDIDPSVVMKLLWLAGLLDLTEYFWPDGSPIERIPDDIEKEKRV